MNKKEILIILSLLLNLNYGFPTFEEYVEKFNKKYEPDEYALREEIYDTKIDEYQNITAYTPGINNKTDWTE